MKNVKYHDLRIGERSFTVRATRYNDDFFGMTVDFTVFEYHVPPKKYFDRLFEVFKYKSYTSDKWIETLSDKSLLKTITDACLRVIQSQNRASEAEKEWEAI